MPSNNDNSSNRLDSKEFQDALKKRKEEADLLNRFKQVATAKLESMANEAKNNKNADGSSKPLYTMGKKEQEIVQSLQGMGIKEGMVATVVAFVTLRRGPIYMARWLQRRKNAARQQQQGYQSSSSSTSAPPLPPGSGGYQLSDPNKVSTNPFARSQNPEFPRSKNPVIRTIWFVFDSVLSLMLGASISMAYTDTNKIRDQLIDLPLVPGRSLVSDALCEEIVQELQKIQREQNPAYKRLMKNKNQSSTTGEMGNGEDTTASLTPGAFYLQGIIGFSENCQRRRFVESQVRQEQGLHSTAPVEIPEPGVSPVGPRLMVNSDTGEEESSFGTESEEEFEDLTRWEASTFVADNEDDDTSFRRGD